MLHFGKVVNLGRNWHQLYFFSRTWIRADAFITQRRSYTSVLQQTNLFEIQELFILKGFEFPFIHTTEFTLQAA